MSNKDIKYVNTVKDSNNTFGYQPTKSSSNTPSHILNRTGFVGESIF